MAQFVFTMYKMTKSYGPKTVLKDINLCFYPGAKIGIVGDNGSGKSTLLKIMAGLDHDFQGTAEPEKGIRVGIVRQEPQLDQSLNVRETVETAFSEIKGMLDEFDGITASMAEPMTDEQMDKAMNRMAKLQDSLDAVDGWNLDRHVQTAADALVLPPDDQSVTTLSGGELRRVALCKALLEKPDILLLDEPTNHLDAETVEWLEQQLREYPGTVIVVTHDRYFLDNITKWILELDHGKGIPFEGNYSSWLEQKIAQMAQAEKKESDRRSSLDRELKWIRMSSEDRDQEHRNRVQNYESLLVNERAISDGASVIEIPSGARLGEKVLEFHNVTKGFEGRTLIKDLSFIFPRGAVVGVIGPNGAGKSTLFRMIADLDKPDSGEIVHGDKVELAYVNQQRDDLNDDNTVWEEISDKQELIDLGGKEVNSRNYCSRFNFRGTDQQKRVGDLSGGERNRVHLAKLVRRGGNFLMLDEPTNDLDVHALRMLEDAINTFTGCALIISHDRFFLDRVCTHLLVFEGDGAVRWFEGNFQDYERWRKETQGGDLFSNRRSKYRSLTLQK
ncbi:TPA: energy-dependent translational throttle protein EttA [Candidatus Sumerlaeota bacterium]|nr:energy-dependent translational throttle protein EttA [Candidatus Sumerlaeota bacterium]